MRLQPPPRPVAPPVICQYAFINVAKLFGDPLEIIGGKLHIGPHVQHLLWVIVCIPQPASNPLAGPGHDLE